MWDHGVPDITPCLLRTFNMNSMQSLDREEIRRRAARFARRRDNIAALYLFGSAATGKMRSTSDIDIAIMSTSTCVIDGFEKAAMETELSNILHRDVDIVVFHQADTLLQHQILKYGKLLYVKDDKERVRQETIARRQYLDTRHLYRKLVV